MRERGRRDGVSERVKMSLEPKQIEREEKEESNAQ